MEEYKLNYLKDYSTDDMEAVSATHDTNYYSTDKSGREWDIGIYFGTILTSDKETKTFLRSPTANISNSSLSFPLEEPSSATVTIAVISRGNCFNPLRSTESPVPPPKTTIFFIMHTS